MRRQCGPLGPYHLHGMRLWHMDGCSHSLIIVSLFTLFSPLGLVSFDVMDSSYASIVGLTARA